MELFEWVARVSRHKNSTESALYVEKICLSLSPNVLLIERVPNQYCRGIKEVASRCLSAPMVR